MNTLDAYLSGFSAAAPGVSPAQSGLVALGVGVAQEIVNLLGSRVKVDGAYGPSTRAAWQDAAIRRKLNPAFDRKGPREAWAHPETYKALAAEAYSKPAPVAAAKPVAKAAAKPTAKKAAKSAATPAPTATAGDGTKNVSVKDLQNMLRGLGWTAAKLSVDGLYGPQTTSAWSSSAKLRSLDGSISRVDSKTARVSVSTYAALSTAAPIGAAASAAAPAAATVVPATLRASALTPSASGMQDVSVSNIQGILAQLGWTKKKLKRDGLYGPQTTSVWSSSSKLRKLDGSISRVDGKTARVSASTYAALSSAADVGAAAVTPPASSMITVPVQGTTNASVADLQSILYGLGWTAAKLKRDGLYGPQTATAWTSSAKLRSLDGSISRVDSKTARVSAATYAALSAAKPATAATVATAAGVTPATAEAAGAPAPQSTPGAPTSAMDEVLLKGATAPVLVSDAQKAFVASHKYPAVQVTGNWNNEVQTALLDTLKQQPDLQASFARVIPQLLMQDGTSIRLLPDQAKFVALGASLYLQQQQAPQPAPLLPPGAAGGDSSIVAQPVQMPGAPMPGAPMPGALMPGASGAYAAQAPSYAPGYAPSGSASYAPSAGGITPMPVGSDGGYAPGGGMPGGSADGGSPPAPATPSPDQAAAAAAPTDTSGADTWSALVQALGQITTDGKTYADALAAATQRGPVHPEVQAAADAWTASAEALKSVAAHAVSASGPLKAAIEASGASVGLSGFGELAAFERLFSGLGAVVDTVLNTLKAPVSITLRGLGQLPQAAELVWGKLIQLLGTPTVAAAGATAIAASGLNKVINGDVQAYQDNNTQLAKMVADGKLTVDEYNALKSKPPGGSGSNFTTVVVAAVALGGLAIYLRNRQKRAA